ncbi:MAG: DNA translocase FtsK 4TM domain-containing protein, partial [Endomicrobium sp.]|nr:DNA translocase FtsK 4TM domain-containing protein [Endomicrobium sp.]
MLDNKNNKKQFTLSKIEYNEIATLFFALLFSFISYVFVFPNKSGLFGWFFYVVTSRFFGTASYFVLLLFLLYFSSSIKSRKQKNENRKKCFALLFSFVISFVILLEILRSIFSVKISGGLVGEKLYKIFIFFFGIRLSLVMIVIVFFFSIAKIIRYLFIDYVCVCFVKFKCNLKSIKNNIYDVKRNIINKFVLRKKLFTLKIFNKKFKKQNIVNNYNNDKKLYSDHIVGTTSNCQIKINDKPFDYKFPNMDLLNVSSTVNFNINKNNFLERAKYLKK